MDIPTLIRIAARIAVPEEAPAGSPFGRWAWAKFREGIPEEEDNPLETFIYQSIQGHFADKRIGIPYQVTEFLVKLMESGLYKPVLHPPPYSTLYRGMKFRSKQDLADFLGVAKEEISKDGAINFEERRTFKPTNGNSTSWTYRKYITEDFSTVGSRGWAATLMADVEENANHFLAGPGGLYDVEGLSNYHLEKETVGLEPILVRRVEWNKI